jgi:hypothetical protein
MDQGGKTMRYQEFKEYYQQFSQLIEQLPQGKNKQMHLLMTRYVEQNMMLLNDILHTSIKNLRQLQHAASVNDIICTQTQFTQEMHDQLSLSTQRFLNASLKQIADYNEWLKTHCAVTAD